MRCPVCGNDCVREAQEIIDTLPDVFAPCDACRPEELDKNAPPPPGPFRTCSCGKRFIDVVCAEIHRIMVEEGDLRSRDPLRSIGFPMVHPGFAMVTPPFLPADSLVLVSPVVNPASAARLKNEIPEVRGVVRSGNFIPGATDPDLASAPRTYQLLAGCDVRADIFYTQTSPLVLYKEQSKIHIEFPRGYDPKIISVGVKVRVRNPKVFVDACSGAGTLGILAGMLGVPHVILNDAWYAAAFWSAYNLRVNMEFMLLDRVNIHREYRDLERVPVSRDPIPVATATGEQQAEVYQGDYRRLPAILPKERAILTALDLFEKADRAMNEKLKKEWLEAVGGDLFIP